MIKSDSWIVQQAEERQMIRPFAREQVREIEMPPRGLRRVISFGASSYGYDMRIGNMFKVLNAPPNKELDPKAINAGHYRVVRADDYIVVPPHGLVLGQTVEYFQIPRDILTICCGKSTYARCGIFVNVTPFEPEWEGFATIAVNNLTPNPVRVYANEGIAQLIFLQANEVCTTSYRDKKGKYQAQQVITTAKV